METSYKTERELKLERAITLHQRWITMRRQTEHVRAQMVVALHEANTYGYSQQDLADHIGLSRQRVGQLMEGA